MGIGGRFGEIGAPVVVGFLGRVEGGNDGRGADGRRMMVGGGGGVLLGRTFDG